MERPQPTDPRERIGAFSTKYLFRAEMAGLALLAVGALLLPMNRETGTAFLILPLVALALMHFFRAFYVSDEIRDKPTLLFYQRLGSWGLSILLMALLFRAIDYPGYDIMYIVGLNTLMIMLFLSVIFQARLRQKHGLMISFHRPWQVRIIVYATLAFLLRYAFSGSGPFASI